MIFLKNKIGAEYLSIWWFVILALVVGSVFISVGIFTSGEKDIREYQIEFLFNKLVNCISENGYLVEDFLENKFVLNSCGIDDSFFEKGSKYFLKIEVESLSGENLGLYEFGRKSFEKDCDISKDISVEEAPYCFLESFTLLYLTEGKSPSKKVAKVNFLIAIENE